MEQGTFRTVVPFADKMAPWGEKLHQRGGGGRRKTSPSTDAVRIVSRFTRSSSKGIVEKRYVQVPPRSGGWGGAHKVHYSTSYPYTKGKTQEMSTSSGSESSSCMVWKVSRMRLRKGCMQAFGP